MGGEESHLAKTAPPIPNARSGGADRQEIETAFSACQIMPKKMNSGCANDCANLATTTLAFLISADFDIAEHARADDFSADGGAGRQDN